MKEALLKDERRAIFVHGDFHPSLGKLLGALLACGRPPICDLLDGEDGASLQRGFWVWVTGFLQAGVVIGCWESSSRQRIDHPCNSAHLRPELAGIILTSISPPVHGAWKGEGRREIVLMLSGRF